jgi:FtsZ-binding cell division protein ZapB
MPIFSKLKLPAMEGIPKYKESTMADEATTTQTVKTASDGSVQIAVEKYNELLETIADQKGSINRLRESLNRLQNEPPVMINRTVVNKTDEMLSQEHRAWGGTFMGLGASLFVVGALRYRRA